MAKNAFTSKTVLFSAAGSASGLVMLLLGFLTDPATVKSASEFADRNGRSDVSNILKDFVLPTLTGIAGIGAIAGRFSVGDLWTPKGLPGKNKDDFKAELTLQEVMQTAMDARDAAMAANNADRLDKVVDLIANLQQRLDIAPPVSPPVTVQPEPPVSQATWTSQLPSWIQPPGSSDSPTRSPEDVI